MALLCWATFFFHIFTKKPAPHAKKSLNEEHREKFLQSLPTGALIVSSDNKIAFANNASNALIPITGDFNVSQTRLFSEYIQELNLERCVTLQESQPMVKMEDTQNKVFKKNAERNLMLTLE